MSSLTGRKRADGQRVSPLLGALLGGFTVTLTIAARWPNKLMRTLIDTSAPLGALGQVPDVRRRDLEVDGADGATLPARLYEPEGGGGDRLLIFLHGGGFVVGSLESHAPTAAFTAHHGRTKVLAVGYRKAPDHRFPTALEDCLAAYRWAVAHKAELGVEHIAVGGDSAGGQLAAAVCLNLGDDEPRPAFAWLVYPLVDGDVNAWESAWLFEKGPLLSRRNAIDMVGHYAGGPHQLLDPRLTVLRAENLEQMPPTYVATAGMDPIRDQGEAFGEALRGAGVDVTTRRFENMPHGFDLLLVDPGARAATQEMCEAVDVAFAAVETTEAAAL